MKVKGLRREMKLESPIIAISSVLSAISRMPVNDKAKCAYAIAKSKLKRGGQRQQYNNK